MVEGTSAPRPPEKKFLKSVSDGSISVSSNDQAPPLLPRKQGRRCFESQGVFHLRQDCIYTALKPVCRVLLSLPADFVVKGAVKGGLLGLQGGRVLKIDWKDKTVTELTGAGNRNISGMIVDNAGNVLIQHSSGQCFGVEDDALVPLFKASCGSLVARPGIAQVFIVGAQETLIIESGAIKQRIPSHFTQFQFTGEEEIAVTRGASQVDLYALSRTLQPVSLGHLELALEHGQLLKCAKIGHLYVTVQAEGKLTLWNLKEQSRLLVPLTTSRISSVLLDTDGKLWIGLQSGHLLVVTVVAEGIEILAELKAHEASIMRIYEQGDTVVSIDTAGQVFIWDRLLQQQHLNRELWRRQREFCNFKAVKVRICSWNVAAQPPTTETNDSVWTGWLGLDEQVDLLIIGLQEIVDLAFMSSNAASSTTAIELWARELKRRLGPEFRLIHSAAMVGLGLLIFVRGKAGREALSWPAEEAVKTGLAGMHGNKGALVWRAFVHDTPLVFAVAHLAAGQKSVNERNNDATTILKTAALPNVSHDFAFPSGNSGTRIFDHCAVFLFGDLNYRLEAERATCEAQIRAGQFEELLEVDQLRSQVRRPELLLSAFKEAKEPSFPPTYKYDQGSVDVFDSSEKRRVPSWCDRILVHSKHCQIEAVRYESVQEATLSDHKPIFGSFEVECRIVDEAKLQGIILQERR